MTLVDVTHRPDIQAIMGASGTGKSHYVKKLIARDRRLLVWDMENEYPDLPALKLSELPAAYAGKKPRRARFVCSMDVKQRGAEFNLFCMIAFQAGNLRLLVEELRFVTTPSRAPEGWAACTLRGRKRGLKVVGTSQRPAQIDKDFLSNATYVRCGALEYPDDRKAVAPILRCSVDQIAALSGFQTLEYRRAG